MNINYNNIIQTYIDRYARNKEFEEISIRNIVQAIKPDRATHMIHPYPAKLLLHIPYFFLNNNILSKEGDVVLDPFCGSGTVLLESQLAHRYSIGVDTNPLANIISETKVEFYQAATLTKYFCFIKKTIKDNKVYDKILFDGVEFWYSQRIINSLSKILFSINLIENLKYRQFFLMCFSNCARKVSFADPKVTVPVKLDFEKRDKRKKYSKLVKHRIDYINSLNITNKFFEIVDQNIQRVIEKNQIFKPKAHAYVINKDVRNFNKLDLKNFYEIGKVDLILTSPPYAGAQKYIRASKLNLSWLGLAGEGILKKLDSITIGRENYLANEYNKFIEVGLSEADSKLKKIHNVNPLRAHITSNYLIEMKHAFSHAVKMLKSGGYLILIIGNNNICGIEFDTQKYLTQILEAMGLQLCLKLVDNIKSYGLMTKRNKTADIINREWILGFKK